MIDAGLPLVQCLEILAQQQDNKFFQQILLQVRQDVEEGSTLAAAMARHPKVFDHLYSNMVEAGETGGILDLILQRLSTFIEKIVKLKRDVISAMIYPAAVIVHGSRRGRGDHGRGNPAVSEDIPGPAWSRRTTSLAHANRGGHQRLPGRLGWSGNPGCHHRHSWWQSSSTTRLLGGRKTSIG